MVIQVIDCSTSQSESTLNQRNPRHKSSVERRLIRDTTSSHMSGEQQVRRYLITGDEKGVVERYTLVIIYIERRRGRKKYCGNDSFSRIYKCGYRRGRASRTVTFELWEKKDRNRILRSSHMTYAIQLCRIGCTCFTCHRSVQTESSHVLLREG